VDLQKMAKGMDEHVERKLLHLKFDQSVNLAKQEDAMPLIVPKRVRREKAKVTKPAGANVAKNPASFVKRRSGAAV
jgi:hypothetical protein